MLASIQIAEHKTPAAAVFRRETKVFENAIQVNNLNYLTTLMDSLPQAAVFHVGCKRQVPWTFSCANGDR